MTRIKPATNLRQKRREFPKSVRFAAWNRSGGWCERKGCGTKLYPAQTQYDHVLPDGLGGEPTLENCEVLCVGCHKDKTGKEDVPRIAKADRARRKIMDGEKKKSRPIPGSKASGWRKRMDGTVERRDQ